MTAQDQPTPGQVIGKDDVAKLRAGDVLLLDGTAVARFRSIFMGGVRADVFDGKHISALPPSRFTFIGRPGPDGFIPWTGGENPVSGVTLEVEIDTGWSKGIVAAVADHYDWSRPCRFRLSPPAGSPPECDLPKQHTPRCWGRTSFSEEVAHCYCPSDKTTVTGSKTEHVAGDAVSGAVERLTALRDQARNGTPVTDPNEWEADELDAILSAVEAQAAEIADLKARNKALEEGLLDVSAHVTGMASAYRTYAKRHSGLTPKAETDALFTTRANDFDLAAARAAKLARTLTEADHGR